MKLSVIQLIGWYGVAAILSAYALLNFGWIDDHNLSYFLLNLTGAAAIIIEAHARHDTQPVVLNIVWAVIALLGLAQLLF